MIKRPFGIYLVAIWSFLIMSQQMQPLINLTQSQPPTERNPYIGGLLVIIFAFIIYVIVGLIQLKIAARVITIIILSSNAVLIPLKMALAPVNQVSFSSRIIVVLLVVVLINILSVLYLCRPKFREICRNFRKQGEKIKQEKNMLRAIKKG